MNILLALEWFDGGCGVATEIPDTSHDEEVRSTAKTVSLSEFLSKIENAKPLTNYSAEWTPNGSVLDDSLELAVEAILIDNGMSELAAEFIEKAEACDDKVGIFNLALQYVTFDLDSFIVLSTMKTEKVEKTAQSLADEVFEHKDREGPLPDPSPVSTAIMGHLDKRQALIESMEKGDIYRFDFKAWKVIQNNKKKQEVTLKVHEGVLSGHTLTLAYRVLMGSEITLIKKTSSLSSFAARKAKILKHKFGQGIKTKSL